MNNTTKEYYNLSAGKHIELIQSPQIGDIFSISGTISSTYMVLDRELSYYDGLLEENWDEPVPVYHLRNLDTGGEYIGILPAGNNICKLLA